MVDEKVANPAALGLGAFALTTIILSLFNAKLLPIGDESVVVILAMAYGGIAQFIAGWWEFKNNNLFGATAFSSFGGFWWFFALLHLSISTNVLTIEDGTAALAATLAAWGIFTFIMWIASFKTNWAVWSVFLTLWITFFLLSAGKFNPTIGIMGGYLGLVCGSLAWYASAAIVINDTFGRTILPIGKAPLS